MQYKKIYLEITNYCNLNCNFCIKNKRVGKFLEIPDFLTILDKIKPYTNYLYFHVLGEPLLHPNINELIDMADKQGFYVNITTNGYLIKRIEHNLHIRQINISLHSYDEIYHLSLETYLKNIVETATLLASRGTYVSLRLWVKNQHHDEIIEFLNRYYHTSIPVDIENFTIGETLFINNFHEFVWPDLTNSIYEEKGSCYALKDHLGILVDGTIVPCCLDTLGIIRLGNIFSDNLEEIISSKRYQMMLEGFCQHKKCEELCKHCQFLNTK